MSILCMALLSMLTLAHVVTEKNRTPFQTPSRSEPMQHTPATKTTPGLLSMSSSLIHGQSSSSQVCADSVGRIQMGLSKSGALITRTPPIYGNSQMNGNPAMRKSSHWGLGQHKHVTWISGIFFMYCRIISKIPWCQVQTTQTAL